MFKLDHRLLGITATVVLGSSLMFGASTSSVGVYKIKNKTAIDGGVTYVKANGVETAYRYNEQSTKGVSFGRAATANEIKAWDVDALPDGTGLPAGSGSVEEGDELYENNVHLVMVTLVVVEMVILN